MQQRTISRGEIEYRERLEDIRVLKLRSNALRRDLGIHKGQVCIFPLSPPHPLPPPPTTTTPPPPSPLPSSLSLPSPVHPLCLSHPLSPFSSQSNNLEGLRGEVYTLQRELLQARPRPS